MNKPVYIGHSILELSKILMYEFWQDYVYPKYGEKATFCYMDGFIVYIKTDDTQKELQGKLTTDLIRQIMNHTSSYKPLPKGKNEKVIGLIKDESGWKIMTKFFVLIKNLQLLNR